MSTIFSLYRSFPRHTFPSRTAKFVASMSSQNRELRTLAQCPQLAISEKDDDPEVRLKHRPFLLEPEIESTDWISQLELETAISMAEKDLQKTGKRLRILVLYGSLRKRYVSECLFVLRNLIHSKFLLETYGLRGLTNPLPSRMRCPHIQPLFPPHPRFG